MPILEIQAINLANVGFRRSPVFLKEQLAQNCYPAENKTWLNFNNNLQEEQTNLLLIRIAGQMFSYASAMLAPSIHAMPTRGFFHEWQRNMTDPPTDSTFNSTNSASTPSALVKIAYNFQQREWACSHARPK